MLTAHTREYKQGKRSSYEGFVVCTDKNAGCLWTEYTNIERLVRNDALIDANNLINDIKSIGGHYE